MAKVKRFTPSREQVLAIALQNLEQEAYQLGLCETARAINAAQQKCGWEIACKPTPDTKAEEGE